MNPQPLDDESILLSDGGLALDDIDRVGKRYDCRRYDRCLTTAARNGWTQFHCRDCKSYEALPADDPARRLFALAGEALFRATRVEREPERDERVEMQPPHADAKARDDRERIDAILRGEHAATVAELDAILRRDRHGRPSRRLDAVTRAALLAARNRALDEERARARYGADQP